MSSLFSDYTKSRLKNDFNKAETLGDFVTLKILLLSAINDLTRWQKEGTEEWWFFSDMFDMVENIIIEME